MTAEDMMDSLTTVTCIRKGCGKPCPDGGLHCPDCLAEKEAGVRKRSLDVIAGGLPNSTPKPIDPRSKMTEVEKRMAAWLDSRMHTGELQAWFFEAMTFRVGIERSNYRPDFVCLLPNGRLEIIEVKGKMVWEDSVKSFKAAALFYPFMRWRMLQWIKGGWKTLHDFGAES